MARDRIFFFASFGLLLLVAAFLFRSGDEPESAPQPKASVVVPQVVPTIKNSIPAEEGMIAVPFQLTKRSGIVQFMSPGTRVDVLFTSSSETGFGTISLTLFRDIKVLGIGRDSTGKRFGDVESFYKANTPIEILLEMTPRQAEVFSYAELSGTISFVLVQTEEEQQSLPFNHLKSKHAKQIMTQVEQFIPLKWQAQLKKQEEAQEKVHDELVEKLLQSESDESFSSILITHMVSELMPDANIKIIATPKGYILTGRVANAEVTTKLLKILELFTSGTDKTIVNLIQEDPGSIEALDTIKKVESISIEPGQRAVSFKLDARSPNVQFLSPGELVDIKFTSNADVGFDTVSLTILKGIRILSIGMDFNGRANVENMTSQVEVLLQMSPREAEIFRYAGELGQLTLEPAGGVEDEKPDPLINQLMKSDSRSSFHSTLITHMVRTIFPTVNVRIGASEKGWLLEGKVPDPQIAEKIIEILEQLVPGAKRNVINLMEVQPQQVLLCVKVFEVVKDVRERVGLNWKLLFDNAGASVAFSAVFPRPVATDPNYFIDANGIDWGKFNLSAIVDMLEETGCGKIIAQPNLTTVSGEKADFFVGGEFPVLIPQGGTLAGTVTVEYKKYGVILEFEPTVDINGLINLHVVPEVSNLDQANAVTLSGFVIPALLSRKVDTKVQLWPGQSYIIGGLYLDEGIKNVDSLYNLNKIPFVGPLFNSKRCQNRRTELMVLITPFIMNDNNTCKNPDCNESSCGQCVFKEGGDNSYKTMRKSCNPVVATPVDTRSRKVEPSSYLRKKFKRKRGRSTSCSSRNGSCYRAGTQQNESNHAVLQSAESTQSSCDTVCARKDVESPKNKNHFPRSRKETTSYKQAFLQGTSYKDVRRSNWRARTRRRN